MCVYACAPCTRPAVAQQRPQPAPGGRLTRNKAEDEEIVTGNRCRTMPGVCQTDKLVPE